MELFTSTVALNGLMSIIVVLLSITFAWTVMRQLRLEALFRRPRPGSVIMLQVLLSVVLGHAFGKFILNYVEWAMMLKWFVE